MGLGGATKAGLFAADDCVGVGFCNASANNCGTPRCNTVGYFISWPNYPNCGHGQTCNLQTGLPKSGTCGTTINLKPRCCNSFNLNCTSIGATIWECGPLAVTRNHGFCKPAGSFPLIGCLTVSAMTWLCGGCNPLADGLVYGTAS